MDAAPEQHGRADLVALALFDVLFPLVDEMTRGFGTGSRDRTKGSTALMVQKQGGSYLPLLGVHVAVADAGLGPTSRDVWASDNACNKDGSLPIISIRNSRNRIVPRVYINHLGRASGANMPGDFPHLTDVLGSFPQIRRYSLISLFFRLPGDTAEAQDKVVAHLQQALASLASDVPWLAGRVVFAGLDATHSGVRHIVSNEGTIPLLVKRGVRPAAEFPTFAQLQDAGFPMAALDPDLLVPPIAASWDSTDPDTVAPVLILQANFVDGGGGLILTVCSNHTTMDMTGLGMVIGYLAKACRGERLTAEEVAQANQDRRNAVPLLGDDYEPGPELDDSLIKPVDKAQQGGSTKVNLPVARWVYFGLDAAALAELKREAGRQDAVPYITTDDAVTALCWRRIQAGRRRANPSAAESELCRTVSMRKTLGLEGYTGHTVDCAYVRLADVCDLPLGEVAASLRRVVRDEDGKQRRHFAGFCTMVGRLADKSVVVNAAHLDPRVDVVVSSYTNLHSCGQSFGPLLGVPVAARRPRMAAHPSLLYLMPKDVEGGIAVAACLTEDDIAFLRRDEEMARYAVYIG